MTKSILSALRADFEPQARHYNKPGCAKKKFQHFPFSGI